MWKSQECFYNNHALNFINKLGLDLFELFFVDFHYLRTKLAQFGVRESSK